MAEIFSFICLMDDQKISTGGNVNTWPGDLKPRPQLAGQLIDCDTVGHLVAWLWY